MRRHKGVFQLKKPVFPAGIRLEKAYLFFFGLSLAAALLTIAWHFGLYHFSLAFLLLGFFSWRLHQGRSFLLFAFLVPLVNSLPALLRVDLPFNYSAPLLFYLSGLILGALSLGRRPAFNFTWSRAYLFFLVILFGGTLLTLARWSNIGLSTLALLKNTPVNAAGDRFSYAVIFPVITFFLAAAAPFAAALVREAGLKTESVWRMLSRGFLLSCLLGLLQRFLWPGLLSQSWWVTEHGHINAGFSDFNAFGFCSGMLFLYHAGRLLWPDNEERPSSRAGLRENLFFLLISLGGVFLSGSRTAFFFVLVAGAGLFFSSRFSTRQKTLLAFATLLLVLLAGGTVRDRLLGNLEFIGKGRETGELLKTLDRLSSGRITMTRNSAAMIAAHPLAGVGAGNFYFYLKQNKINESDPLLDLPLNQYLLPAAELGLTGLLAFLFFLIRTVSSSGRRMKIMIGSVLTVFLFGTPLWLPEAAVFFWLLLAESKSPEKITESNKKVFLAGLILALFFLGGLLSWSSLHPLALNRQTGASYDYGLWYQEKDAAGRAFNWSGRAAGFFLQLDAQGLAPGLQIAAEAPFSHIPANRQQISLYWRGRLWRRLEFSAPTVVPLDLQAEPGAIGFFEVRVKPAFNLKQLGLGPETRSLGVKVYRR